MLKIEGEKLLANVIRGLRCANLKDCRNTSGNDRGVEAFGNDCGENSKVNLSNVINGLRPVNLKDYRIKSGNDWCWKRWFNSCYKFVNTPHSALSSHSLPQGAREGGRSMIEMLGVLAIIGFLSVGGIAGYSKAMTKFKTNQIIDQVSTIVTNIKSLYAQQNSYENLDTETAYMLGAIPDEIGSYCDWGDCASNAFNGAIYVGHPYHYGDGQSFIIVYDGLPRETCIVLATNNWRSQSLKSLAYSGEVTSGFLNMLSYDNYEIAAPEDAASGCDCKNGNTCVIGWRFK